VRAAGDGFRSLAVARVAFEQSNGCVMTVRRMVIAMVVMLAAMTGPCAALTVTPELAKDLALGENDAKVQAIGALVALGNAAALAVLQALSDGEVQTAGEQVVWIKDGKATDLATGKVVMPLPEARDDVILNNRVRAAGQRSCAETPPLPARSPPAAAKELQSGADEACCHAIERALANSRPPASRRADAGAGDPFSCRAAAGRRIAAIRALAESHDPNQDALPLLERRVRFQGGRRTCAPRPKLRGARSKAGSRWARRLAASSAD
jgi:hypothetical protein